MPDRVSAGSRDEPPRPAMSDAKATLLACGCLTAFAVVDLAVAAGLAFLFLRWFG